MEINNIFVVNRNIGWNSRLKKKKKIYLYVDKVCCCLSSYICIVLLYISSYISSYWGSISNSIPSVGLVYPYMNLGSYFEINK